MLSLSPDNSIAGSLTQFSSELMLINTSCFLLGFLVLHGRNDSCCFNICTNWGFVVALFSI
ncbi:unnamed protein product [Malus baccata var. baccata]